MWYDDKREQLLHKEYGGEGGVLKLTLGAVVSLERDKTTIDILDQHDNHPHSYIRKLYHSYPLIKIYYFNI